jgi:hypothetical protein
LIMIIIIFAVVRDHVPQGLAGVIRGSEV